mgnify:CR=1 FL=1
MFISLTLALKAAYSYSGTAGAISFALEAVPGSTRLRDIECPHHEFNETVRRPDPAIPL